MTVWNAVGAVLGGLFGRSKTKTTSAGDNFYSHVGGIVNAARDFGFNPLTLLTNGQAIGPSSVTQDNSAFGAGIANAFAIAGDTFLSKRNTAAKLNQYQKQNERLQNRLNAITLRPPVPGVYGRNSLPADPEVYGGQGPEVPSSYVPSVAGPAGGPRPLRTTDAGFLGDPRREYDNQPVKSHSGTIVIDNPALPIPAKVLTLDGDEPLHWYEYPSLIQPAIGMGIDIASTFDPTMNGNFDGVDPDRWKRRKPKKRPYERIGRDGALPLRTRDQMWSF